MKMTQTSSKKKPKRDEVLKFSDGTKIKMTKSQAGSLRTKVGAKQMSGIRKNPEGPQITELPDEEVAGKDQYDDLFYPPPSRNKSFREVWGRGIKNLMHRDNFDPSQLIVFEIYCSLVVTLRRLDQFISRNGQTYKVITVTGEFRKTYPEVLERNKTIAQLGSYTKLLGLMPTKNKSKASAKEDEADNWE